LVLKPSLIQHCSSTPIIDSMAFDSKGAYNSSTSRGFFASIMSLLNETECCAMRSHSNTDFMDTGRPCAPIRQKEFPGPPACIEPGYSSECLTRGSPTSHLPLDFFKRLGEMLVRDPQVAQRIDLASFVCSADGRTRRVQFLQTCVSGNHQSCSAIWPRLNYTDRHEFIQAYGFGPPSIDFFLNMIMEDEAVGSDCGSGSTDMDARSDYTSDLETLCRASTLDLMRR